MRKTTFCDRCDISVYNKFHPFWGQGDENADIIFINSFPSRRERRLSKAYNGKRYSTFERFLYVYNFTLENAYFTHIVKCTTPKGREPSYVEMRNCTSYLLEEFSIKPKIIVLLGQNVMQFVLNDTTLTIGKEHGKPRILGKYVIIPTFSPAFMNLNLNKLKYFVHDWDVIFNHYRVLYPTHSKTFL